jgi:hypothetical protein
MDAPGSFFTIVGQTVARFARDRRLRADDALATTTFVLSRSKAVAELDGVFSRLVQNYANSRYGTSVAKWVAFVHPPS